MVDRWGTAVAITSSLNRAFWAKSVSPSTGLVLENQMGDFAAAREAANTFGLPVAAVMRVALGKRPLSSAWP